MMKNLLEVKVKDFTGIIRSAVYGASGDKSWA
jgi:hypothetical protein